MKGNEKEISGRIGLKPAVYWGFSVCLYRGNSDTGDCWSLRVYFKCLHSVSVCSGITFFIVLAVSDY